MDLRTSYLGLDLENPLVPSSSPLSENLDNLRRMEDAGAGAVVLHSLFEEQIESDKNALDHYLAHGTESYAESLTYLPEPVEYRLGVRDYLELVRRAKEMLRIPVIASVNGVARGGWVEVVRQFDQAGASAIELNLYNVEADLARGAAQVEGQIQDIVREFRAVTTLPLAVKIGPYFTAMANMAVGLVQAGADGLVLFNRFYQPDIDLDHLEVRPNILLSTPQAMRLPLRWVAILHGRIKASLAATGGIHSHEDVAKMLLVGADVTMMCSALLKNGIPYLSQVRSGLVRWMEKMEYESVSQMKGSMSQRTCENPSAFERANYVKALAGYHLPA